MDYLADVEIGGGYMTAQDSIYIRNCLIESDRPQPLTLIQMDNTTDKELWKQNNQIKNVGNQRDILLTT